MCRKTLVVAVLLMLVAASGWASGASEQEADFPTREVTLYVGFSAGGGTDVLTRRLAQNMEPALGVPVVVENRPGAGALVANQQVSQADPDGYTLSVLLGNQFLQKYYQEADAWIDPLEDVTLIGVFNRDAWGIAVPESAPYDTFEEFIAYAEENPGVQVGSGPPGTLYYWTWQAVIANTGVDLTIVPYEGTSQSLAAAAGEEVAAAGAGPGEAASLMDGDLVKMIGVASEERISVYPDIPTFAEQGFDIVVGPWRAIVGPPGMPEDVVETLAGAVESAYNSDDFQGFIRENGHGAFFRGPQEGKDFFESEDQFFLDLMEAAGQAR